MRAPQRRRVRRAAGSAFGRLGSVREIRDMHKPLSTGETAERGFWIESKNLIAWRACTKCGRNAVQATARKPSPSASQRKPNLASQMRVAFSSMA